MQTGRDTLRHKSIGAAAGAGKTYQLVHRFVGLLLSGVPPERIIALTFSRKAAGEMFDRIIRALAEAADSETKAVELGNALRDTGNVYGGADVSCEHVGNLLRDVLHAMHRMRVGTLDSFFFSILQAFPFEFGLGGDLEIVDGFPAANAKQQALRGVLERSGGERGESVRGFLEDFKQATFGQEAKRFSDILNQFIDACHGQYLEASSGALWGNPDRIWPDGCPWLEAARPDPGAAAAHLAALLDDAELSARQRERWEGFLQGVSRFSPAGTWDEVKYLFCKLAPMADDLRRGHAVLSTDRQDFEMDPAVCRCVLQLVSHVVRGSLEACLERTRGMYRVLHHYENQYRRSVRNRGRLTFQDVTFLLASGVQGDSEPAAGPVLSAYPGDADRLYVDYRLDSHYDHWLLDEFQDTSTLQWRAMQNLIDEVVQNGSGGRSLFYVGDVKQAIYGWRGGDPKLFDWVRDSYNDGQPRPLIEHQPLAKSWRSSRAVIDAVNAVFEGVHERGLNVDPRLWQRWQLNWQPHDTARVALPGFAGIYQLPRCAGRGHAEDQENRCRLTADILRECRPWDKGRSAAVLVRTNDQGKRLVEYLRGQGLSVAFEGSFRLLDHPVTSAFRSLVKLAEHPGDTFAWQHVGMTPLAAHIGQGVRPPAELVVRLLNTIHTHGFESLIATWGELIAAQLDAYSRKSMDDLVGAAREFDAVGSRNCLDFISFLESYEVADAAAACAVQVMTVHKAKGLEFDMVVLPELDRGGGIQSSGSGGLFLKRSASVSRRPEWVLEMPRKDVAATDSTLAAVLDDAALDEAYEELCTLYVALTRAKHAVYVVMTEPPASRSTVYPSTVIRTGLPPDGGTPVSVGASQPTLLYGTGDPMWHAALDAAAPVPPVVTDVRLEAGGSRKRFERRTPSGEEDIGQRAGQLFSLRAESAAGLGTAVHQLFAEVEWWSPDMDPLAVALNAESRIEVADPMLAEQARDEFVRAMRMNSIQAALARPDPAAVVWRERRFEVILDRTWVSGCFDRVVFEPAADGEWKAATIVDFKTSQIETAEARERALRMYRPQLAVYRQVLTSMVALPAHAVRLLLVFTKTGDVADVTGNAGDG